VRGGDERTRREGGGGAEVRPSREAENDDDERGHPHGDGAKVVRPLGKIEAEKIQDGKTGKEEYREADEVDRLSGEMLQRGMKEEDVAGGEVENTREIREIAGPVHPGAKEAGAFAEGFFSPDVESAFGWESGRKGNYGNGERNVEEQPGAEPDDEGRGTVSGGGSDPAEADASNDIEEEEIAKTHDSRGSGGGDWSRGRDFGGRRRGNAGQEEEPPSGKDGETVSRLWRKVNGKSEDFLIRAISFCVHRNE
jgi:hypothetical protein